MRLKFKGDAKQVELIKATGSKDKVKSSEAMEALASYVGPLAQKVIQVAGTSNMLFTTETYNADDAPSVALDTFYQESEGYVTVWTQHLAGGLPSSQTAGVAELKLAEYRLDSSVSWNKQWARRSRLDVVAKTISRMINEVLIKQEKMGWSVVLQGLAEASTNGLSHVIDSTTADVFQLHDLNRLLTRARRINTAYNGMTPEVEQSRGITDLFVSPEIIEQIRSFAYQPMNTRGVPDSSESTAVALPDDIRERIFNAAGTQEIYGIGITEVLELGDNERYNRLFAEFYGGSFTFGSDQILIGADLSRESAIRMLAKDLSTGNTFEVLPDDQYLVRQDKAGVYGALTEGRILVDPKPLLGIKV